MSDPICEQSSKRDEKNFNLNFYNMYNANTIYILTHMDRFKRLCFILLQNNTNKLCFHYSFNKEFRI